MFLQSAEAPKYVTFDIEFRDPAAKRWPNFAYGKPAAAGKLIYDPKKPTINVSLKTDKGVQLQGDQSNRVIGDLIANEQFPTITVHLTDADTFKTVPMEREEKGKKVTKETEVMPVKGELVIGSQKVPFTALATIEYHTEKNQPLPNWLTLNIKTEVSGKSLGLKQDNPVAIRISTTVYTELPGKKK